MKKIILTALLAVFLLNVKGQQGNSGNLLRKQLSELNSMNDDRELAARLQELQRGEKEDSYLIAYNYYASKNMNEQAGSLQQSILRKFPNGRLALQKQIQELSEVSDLHEKDRRFMDLYKEFPQGNFGFLTYSLSQEFAALGDDEKMRFYADIYAKVATDGNGNPVKKEILYSMMAVSMVRANPDLAASYLKPGVEAAKISLTELKDNGSSDQNLLSRAQGNYLSMLSSYIVALSNGKDAESGYRQASEVYHSLKNDTNADPAAVSYLEKAYLHSLLNTKRYKEALPLMEEAIKQDNASQEINNELKAAYTSVKGSDRGYDAFLSGLIVERERNNQQAIQKMSINEPAPNFELKDVDGKIVKLSDFKGKVVVLDFWATWCGPCKASFPAMQQAVNRYKNDAGVKFLFLHTWEKGGGDAAQQAKKYILDNNYTFEVLMDLRDSQTKTSSVASAYKVDGIPAKFIIDVNGKIRFSTSGFGADAEKAVKELSDMIEYAKKG